MDKPLTPLEFRRSLRATSTKAERKLWSMVRAGRLDGLKVRRQHTVGPYTIDFYIADHQIAIELDGNVHDDPARHAYDSHRERCLTEKGLVILRLSNDQVRSDPESVVAAIRQSIADRP